MMPFNVVARVKNMTRETKLGLAVSCSFLGLVGVVLVLKMTERPEEEQGPEVAAAAPNEAPPPAPAPETNPWQKIDPPAPAAGKNAPGPFTIADDKVIPVSGPVSPAPPPPETKKTVPHLPPVTGGDPTIPLLPPVDVPTTEVGSGGGKAVKPGAGALTTSNPKKEKATPLPPPVPTTAAPRGNWPWQTALLAARSKKGPAGASGSVPPLPPVPSAPADPPLPPVPGDGPKVVEGGELPPIPGVDGDKSPANGAGGWLTVAALAKAGDATPAPKGGTTGGITLPPPPPPPPDTNVTAPPLPDLPPAGGAGKAVAAVTGTGPKEQHDAIPSIDVGTIDVGTGGKPIKVSDPPAVATKPPLSPRPAPAPSTETEPIVVGARPDASVPPLRLSPSPAPASVRSAQPDVVSYTEDSYVAAAGDTFRSISKAKYGNEAYGHALYLFNRSHPLAGDELLQTDALQARQTVYVPPAKILESRYAAAISDAGAPGASGVSVGTTSRRADASPAAARTYRVAAGGEKVYDIARSLLGDGNRWVEIQKLNPGWNWEVPIPANVTLQVPADARPPR
jgi:hypothetical protein